MSMRLPPSFLDEIKTRLPVSQVVGKRVRLIKAGREWKGLSPFNKEKSPSFFVNDTKQAWFDFSSGKNGNIFTFLMETEGLSFIEAVERLAGEAGLAMPERSAEGEERERARVGLYEACEMAAAFFQAQLAGSLGAKARRYLEGRDLGSDIQKSFRLGYAPAERFSLRDHLAGKGVSAAVMIEAGLLIAGEDIPVPYDRFRDRVMFPICDGKGRVIAFGGRALEKDVQAKYLNSNETPLFHKGHTLYNLHNARKPAHDRGTIIAVEGYVDVIAMTRAGLPHVVAPLGTALTEDQLAMLWRLADEPVLCFDGDKAGRKAAYRAIEVALPALSAGKSLRFALLPEGQDPDELLRSGGAGALRAALETTVPLVDLLWSREAEAGPLETPEQRAALEARLDAATARIKDETVKRHYRIAVAERVETLFPRHARGGRTGFRGEQAVSLRGGQGYRNLAGRGGPSGRGMQAPRASAALARHPLFAAKPGLSPREALILALYLRHPHLVEVQLEEISALVFRGPEAQRLKQALVDVAASGARPEEFAPIIERIGLGDLVMRMEQTVRPGDRWALAKDVSVLDISDTLRQALGLHRRAVTLHQEIVDAERALVDEEDESALSRLAALKLQLERLDDAEAISDGTEGLGA
jgi:DNA primase